MNLMTYTPVLLSISNTLGRYQQHSCMVKQSTLSANLYRIYGITWSRRHLIRIIELLEGYGVLGVRRQRKEISPSQWRQIPNTYWITAKGYRFLAVLGHWVVKPFKALRVTWMSLQKGSYSQKREVQDLISMEAVKKNPKHGEKIREILKALQSKGHFVSA